MMTGSGHNNPLDPTDLPQWADCDCFCIHGYAGTGASPCGWRGQLHAARRDARGETLLCPRCGYATLFRIPLDRADEPGT